MRLEYLIAPFLRFIDKNYGRIAYLCEIIRMCKLGVD